MAHIDGTKLVTVAGLLVAARRLQKPWQEPSVPGHASYEQALVDLIAAVSGHDSGEERALLRKMITRLYVPVPEENMAELEKAVDHAEEDQAFVDAISEWPGDGEAAR